jgi:molybdopterin/thiamine biosynthesis adenylyltransferase
MHNPLRNFQSGSSLSSGQQEYILQPVFYRPAEEKDAKKMALLLEEKPYIGLHDMMHHQLEELMKMHHPSDKFTKDMIQQALTRHLNGQPEWAYGVWVYYPWNERLIHILDKEEFTALRTSRNLYKITPEERDLLATKKIGVIGLSVGQSVSLTLAMERAFGELRIADLDTLDLSNMNRLRTGLHNIGLPKTVIVAREIAEIDPFLKVTCFHEGITEQNIDAFIRENGMLDLLIDECDGIDIKILCRVKAKKYGIPVVMEASDRATIDIERFDLEPNRPIFHGLIDHLDISKVKYLKTSEEKVPYILPIAGVETLSTRMKASMIEVGETITTWPQLASAVSLGGGISADVCRRILLDQLHLSGRFFIDIEELIGDKKDAPAVPSGEIPDLTPAIMESTVEKINMPRDPEQIAPSKEQTEEIISAAMAAPSAGNNQPWKWYFDGLNLWLFHDIKRSYSYGDFKDMASFTALGAAIENATLKAKELQMNMTVQLFPLETNKSNPIALIKMFKKGPQEIRQDILSKYIYLRCTNRQPGTGAKIPDDVFRKISASVEMIPGARFHYIDRQDDIEKLAHICGTSERLRIFIPEGHYDLFERELRWTPEEAKSTGDGIDLATFNVTPTEYIGLRLAKDREAIEYLRRWGAGKALEKLTRKAVHTSSAIGLITMPHFSPEDFIMGGRAVERMWLTATQNNVSIQPMLAALLHFARLLEGKGENMPDQIQKEFTQLYRLYSEIWKKKTDDSKDIFLFRLCYANTPEIKSYRLTMNEVYFSKEKMERNAHRTIQGLQGD